MKRRTREITQKEKDLLQLVANGWKDSEIQDRLSISSSTIRNRLESLYVKTETFNRPQLVYWACKNGILN